LGKAFDAVELQVLAQSLRTEQTVARSRSAITQANQQPVRSARGVNVVHRRAAVDPDELAFEIGSGLVSTNRRRRCHADVSGSAAFYVT
jgi:hypothetical protein